MCIIFQTHVTRRQLAPFNGSSPRFPPGLLFPTKAKNKTTELSKLSELLRSICRS